MVKQAERSKGGEACEVSQAGSKTQFEGKDIEPSRRKWVMQAAISLTAASCAIQQEPCSLVDRFSLLKPPRLAKENAGAVGAVTLVTLHGKILSRPTELNCS